MQVTLRLFLELLRQLLGCFTNGRNTIQLISTVKAVVSDDLGEFPDKNGQNLKGGHFKRMGSLRRELRVKRLAYVVIYDRFRQNSNFKIAYVVYHPKFDQGRVNASSAGGCLRELKSEEGKD